jgi:hypothetical protein
MVATKDLLDELRAYELPTEHYVIAASGPLGVRGIREISDIDIAVDDWLWARLAATHGVDPAAASFHLSANVEAYRADKFPAHDGLPTIAEQIATAEMIDGLPFLHLSHLLKLKRARAWEKDLRDVELIREWLDEADEGAS